MESVQTKVETWFKNQTKKWSFFHHNQIKWPWNKNEREERKKLQEEYERRRKQLQELCHAVKAENVSDLQDILCCMVLSECVYKRPATEIIRVVNKFKADFGGQVVSLERVQPSLDHVPHRYLLAEAGDTLFASFIGTKQYKDLIADANILQGAVFHEAEDIEENEIIDFDQVEDQDLGKSLSTKTDKQKHKSKPAAHRGFLARAKGIPALELYRLAQKKNRKLVLCGHSLGGAVAALATLAILRVIASSSSPKEGKSVQVRCITFSQPPVGNAALKDYVHRKGWRHYFKTYCIPEDLVPRILSPAYFHHYNAEASKMSADGGVIGTSTAGGEKELERSESTKLKENGGEQLVLGLGPVQKSFWRLSRLVPIQAVQEHFNKFRGERTVLGGISSLGDAVVTSTVDEVDAAQSLEIQEGSDGISLKPFSNTQEETDEAKSSKFCEKKVTGAGDYRGWRRVPSLPSYVPFGQLYLLGNSSVESLSAAEYSKLTSSFLEPLIFVAFCWQRHLQVSSVISELRERFQSHSMRSYRSRFQKIYESCMCSSPFLGVEQFAQFPNLQQWLGLAIAGAVELGHIVETPIIRTATSIVPLGWSGAPGGKNGEPLKIDITGYGLHLCSLVQAQLNGNWCSTTVESLPSMPTFSSNHELQPDMQKMRILVGAPVRNQGKHQIVNESLMPTFPNNDMGNSSSRRKFDIGSSHEGVSRPEGLNDLVVFCTSDFATASKEVFVRTRRVQLVGLEGAGKTSLFNAILGQGMVTSINLESVRPEIDHQEGMAVGLCFLDSAGVNLQELSLEVARFRDKLWTGVHDLSRKTDLIVLVHNLSHKVPRYSQSNVSKPHSALSLLLNEAKALGIPWVLAITNKFSVSAHQHKAAVHAIIQAYEASPSMTEVINSCPYVMPSTAITTQSWSSVDDGEPKGRINPQRLVFNPINLVRMPFQKKTTTLPVDGVTSLCQLMHRTLRIHEEAAFQELARERLMLESSREQEIAAVAREDYQGRGSSLSAAAVGASIGAGLGLVLAVVMGAASALRKP
ncbi:hypothetical protein IFM89_023089 [Coptis chinensis]|uniref:Fungal lipase-type domain-containing protein n=1 Tax=Coptis chinensis TaxID=261450 RepID=A0A835HWN7_9MAGN|nr:hypothetical protein IFM89_023089 [Coptis chinensis]